MVPNDSKVTVAKRAGTLRLQRGQRLSPACGDLQVRYQIVSGLIAVEISPDAERRQILAFLGAGECLSFADYPGLPGVQARAIVATMLSGVPTAGHAAEETDQATAARLRKAVTGARMLIAVLGRLTGEEKVATFLLEQALRAARPGDSEARVLLAMTRRDIADYLGLNADTLSRELTRLRQSSIISLSGRSDVHIRDIARLAGITPLGGAMQRIYDRGAHT